MHNIELLSISSPALAHFNDEPSTSKVAASGRQQTSALIRKQSRSVVIELLADDIKLDKQLCISGQVPLIPSSLNLPVERSAPLELALAAQHVRRLLAAVPSGQDYSICGGIAWTTRPIAPRLAQLAWSDLASDGVRLSSHLG